MNAIQLDTSAERSRSGYFLSPHVFACVSGHRAVLLDVKRDEYLGIDEVDETALALLVEDWPRAESHHLEKQAFTGSSPSGIVHELMEMGLLTTERPVTVDGTRLPGARHDLESDQSFNDQKLDFRALGRTVEAVIRASFYLRYRPLEWVTSRVRRRREKEASGSRPEPRISLAAARQKFCAIRPYFYRAQEACLFDSLCMLTFLNSFGHFPYWVFGVQISPFSAHCWLQLDALVLNDTLDHVSLFSPIMIV